MQLFKIMVIVCILTVTSCRTEIFTEDRSESKLTRKLLDDVIHIVTSCYGNRMNGIGLVGDIPDSLPRMLTTKHLIPVVLISYFEPEDEIVRLPRAPIQFRQKLQVFIVYSYSAFVADTMRYKVFTSIWWNPMASVLFLSLSDDCDEKDSMVSTPPWLFKLLHEKLICTDPVKTMINVYNHFKSQAPVPWKRSGVAKVYNDKQGDFIYVFTSTYRRNMSICSTLDFDKTKDAGGYEIQVEGHPPNTLVPVRTKTNRAAYEHHIKMGRILEIVYRTMNVTPRFSRTERFNQHITKDMFAVSEVIRYKWTTAWLTTYPHEQVGFVLVTQFRGHKSQLNKILSVTDISSRIGLGIVYLITMIFLKFFVRQALVPALLNLIRITCNSSFANLPDNNPTRVYLTSLLFFVVTLQGIYQGNLATLLTTRIPVKNIDTMMDLVNFDYKLYGDPMVESMIEYPELRKRFLPVRLNDCISHVLEDSSAACMAILNYKVLDKAREFDLHISGELIGTEYSGFTIRWNWFFEERINSILTSMFEADILEPWLHRCNPIKLIDFKYDKDVLSNTRIKVLELGELTFAFGILGIGLSFATVTFILELVVGFKCTMLRRDIIN